MAQSLLDTVIMIFGLYLLFGYLFPLISDIVKVGMIIFALLIIQSLMGTTYSFELYRDKDQ